MDEPSEESSSIDVNSSVPSQTFEPLSVKGLSTGLSNVVDKPSDECLNIQLTLKDPEPITTTTTSFPVHNFPHGTKPTSISQYFHPGENSAEQIRQRLHTALAQTRMLRQMFTEKLYEKHRIVLKPVPSSTEDMIETITSRPHWVQSELIKRMNYTWAEKETEKNEAQELNAEMTAAQAAGYALPFLRNVGDVENAEQLSWISAGLSLVILPEDESVDVDELASRGIQERGPLDLQTGLKVPDISAAAATAGHTILERVRKSAWLRSERKRKRDQTLHLPTEYHEEYAESLQYPSSSVGASTSMIKMHGHILTKIEDQSEHSNTLLSSKTFQTQKLPQGKKGKVQRNKLQPSYPRDVRVESKKTKTNNIHLLSLSAKDESIGTHGYMTSAACALLAHRQNESKEKAWSSPFKTSFSTETQSSMSHVSNDCLSTHVIPSAPMNLADQCLAKVLKPFISINDDSLQKSSPSLGTRDVLSLPLQDEIKSKENLNEDQSVKSNSMNSSLVLSVLYAIGLLSESSSSYSTDPVSSSKSYSKKATSLAFEKNSKKHSESLKMIVNAEDRPYVMISETSISKRIIDRCTSHEIENSEDQKVKVTDPNHHDPLHTMLLEKAVIQEDLLEHNMATHPQFFPFSEDTHGPTLNNHPNLPMPAIALGSQTLGINYSRSDSLHPTAQVPSTSVPFPIPNICNTDYRYDSHVPTTTSYLYTNSNYIHPLPYATGLSPYQLAQLPVDSQPTYISTKISSALKEVANSTILSKTLQANPRNQYSGAMNNVSAWPTTGFIASFGGHLSPQTSHYGGLMNPPNPVPLNSATRITHPFSGSYTPTAPPINSPSVPFKPPSVPVHLVKMPSSQLSNGNKYLGSNKANSNGDDGIAQVIGEDPSSISASINPNVDNIRVDMGHKSAVIIADDSSGEEIMINKMPENSVVSTTEKDPLTGFYKPFSETLYMDHTLDEILPNLQTLIPLIRDLQVFALKTLCRERALLASLLSKNIRVSEAFSHSYTSAMIRAGYVLGYESLCEIVKDEKTRTCTLLPFDVLYDVSGAWEDPCKELDCETFNLVGEELTRRAHAKALFHKSLRKLQDRFGIVGGTTNEGPYGEPSMSRTAPFIKRAASISLPIKAAVPTSNRSNFFKRKSSFCSTSDVTTGFNAGMSSITISGCYSNPYFIDMDEIENKPYGRYGPDESSRSPCDIRPFNASSNSTKRMRLEHSSNILMTRSTYEIEWSDIANLFQTISSINNSGDKLGLPRSLSNQSDMMFSASSTIFAPFCRKIETANGFSMEDSQESDSEEDITDSRLLKSHQIVLDKMKEKLDAIMAIRRKYLDRSRKRA